MYMYTEALTFLNQFVNYEETFPASYQGAFRLARMHRLLKALGSPEHQWPAIHVAGTKGKGSTCALMASVLHAAGHRVGLYTSPHLVSLRERIQLNGQWATEGDVIDACAAMQAAIDPREEPPSFFEVNTAMAFWLFARWGIEIAVVEVGLGGRLDATNVLKPLVSVVTPISRDHTDLLGSTLTEIAREKAGIIKPRHPVVVAPQADEAAEVLRAAAAAARVPVREVAQWVTARPVESSVNGQRVLLRTLHRDYSALELPLLGSHQVVNLATAVTALETLPLEWRVPPEAVRGGVAQVHWPGRLQILERKPWVVIDGAQNAASSEALVEAVRTLWPGAPIHLIVGMSANKDVEGMARPLASLCDSVTVTQARVPRALPAAQLGLRLRPWFRAIEIVDSVGEAVARAKARSMLEDVILVTGSFYVIGELLQQGSGAPFALHPAPGCPTTSPWLDRLRRSRSAFGGDIKGRGHLLPSV